MCGFLRMDYGVFSLFFLNNPLILGTDTARDCLEKKEKKLGGLRSVGGELRDGGGRGDVRLQAM